MRSQYLTLVMAGMTVILAQPVTAQMAPVKPDAIRSQISQATSAHATAAAPAKAAAPAPAKASVPVPAKAVAQSPAKAVAPKPVKAAAPAQTKPAAPASAKAAAPASAKAAAPASAKAAAPVAQNPAAPAAAQAAPKPPVSTGGGAKRDPFDPLLGQAPPAAGGPGPDRLPPGKAGLMVSTLRLDGLVRGPNGMIAVVSNPQQRVYFLREGDHIFDGQVTHITLEAVSFQQTGRDAFGSSLEHEVTRRLYPSPGEQR